MKQIFNNKAILAHLIYIMVSIVIYFIYFIFLGLNSPFPYQDWLLFLPSAIIFAIQWYILSTTFGYSKDATIKPGDPYLPFLLFLVLHHALSYLIVNIITLIFKRKTLKQLLGN
jgi:hypothetical protein